MEFRDWALGPWHGPGPFLGGPVMRALPNVVVITLVLGMANGQPNVILMTLVLGVASDQPECSCGGTLGFGPWAPGMALGPF